MGIFKFFGGLFNKEARAERKRDRDYRRSQKRQERMERREEKRRQKEKERRAAEERRAKEEQAQKEEERYKQSEKTFNDRWGFNASMYDNFIQFMNAIPPEVREAFGSEQLVEIFRAGSNINMSPEDLAGLVMESWTSAEDMTAEELVNDLYERMERWESDNTYD
jgi:hypothetical protein